MNGKPQQVSIITEKYQSGKVFLVKIINNIETIEEIKNDEKKLPKRLK